MVKGIWGSRVFGALSDKIVLEPKEFLHYDESLLISGPEDIVKTGVVLPVVAQPNVTLKLSLGIAVWPCCMSSIVKLKPWQMNNGTPDAVGRKTPDRWSDHVQQPA